MTKEELRIVVLMLDIAMAKLLACFLVAYSVRMPEMYVNFYRVHVLDIGGVLCVYSRDD